MVDMIVGRVLDRLGIENSLFHRWGKSGGRQEGK
jgi:3-polyprenyl-4-hydroxybenzoate decarboxylase